MKFIYKNGVRFSDKKLIKHLSEAAIRLEHKLQQLDIEKLAISDYIKNYATKHIESIEHTLQMYTYLFYLALNEHPIATKEIVLVDYGGGTGILSFYAAELGFSKVIYNDVYDVCCRDAAVLANALGYEIEIVEGGINELIHFCKTGKIDCHLVVSSEVIEHVYDVEDLLEKIYKLGEEVPMRVVLETAANSQNPMINRRLMKAQQEVDRKDRKMIYGKKQQDSLEAYSTIRLALLESFAEGKLSSKELEKLASLTRGKVKVEIEQAAKKYLETGQLPIVIPHPTNTCDPITGNWCEKLMNPYELNKILIKYGFETKVIKGFYGNNKRSLSMKVVKALFNISIGLWGSKGVHMAPYYVLWGARNLK